jgi:hypothetical protein
MYIYIGIVQTKNMIKYLKANLADMLHSDSSICILLVSKNIINGKVNLADVLHSDSSLKEMSVIFWEPYILNEVLNVHEVI